MIAPPPITPTKPVTTFQRCPLRRINDFSRTPLSV